MDAQILGGTLSILSGFALIGYGLWRGGRLRHQTSRARRTKAVVCATIPEGWGTWFFHGVTDAAAGASLLAALGSALLWIVVGAALIGMGAHVIRA